MLLCPSTWRRASLGPITCIYLKRLSTIVQCASWLIFSRNITRILTALSTDNYVICSETDCEIRSVETLALEHIVYWHGLWKFRETILIESRYSVDLIRTIYCTLVFLYLCSLSLIRFFVERIMHVWNVYIIKVVYPEVCVFYFTFLLRNWWKWMKKDLLRTRFNRHEANNIFWFIVIFLNMVIIIII